MKKRILYFLTSLNTGGTERVTISYLNALASANTYDIQLCVMFPLSSVPTLEKEVHGSISITYLASPETGDQFNERYLLYSSGYLQKILYATFRVFWNVRLQARFDRLVRDFDPDVMVQADTGMPPYFKKFKHPTKLIFVHFALSHLFSNFLKSYRIKSWAAQLTNYDYVIAISKTMLQQLEPYCKKEQLVLLYNPIPVAAIEQLSTIQVELPANFKQNDYIVSVGRLDENQKNFTGLINAIKIINEKYNTRYKLLIVGDGRSRTMLEEQIALNSLEDQVVLLGSKSNPYPFVRNSSLFVLSTRFEGLPTVLLEALFLDKLIISSDCPTGPSEILDHPSLLVAVGNDEAMANAIHNLLSNETSQETVREHLRAQKKIFDSSRSISTLEHLFLNQNRL